MRKVFIFGTFDGLHEGHHSLLRQARAHGDHLTIAVAQDHIVEQLKNHPPKKPMHERIDALLEVDGVDIVIPGDEELGTYHVVRRHKPDVIALGYDQRELKFDLEEHARDFDWEVEIVVLEPFEPEKYHSSILENNSGK